MLIRQQLGQGMDQNSDNQVRIRPITFIMNELRPIILVIALIMPLANACKEDGSERPPNIVFIMADDLGYNDLASYGQEFFPTPHTDRLAREGMRFTDAHSPCAVCSPTRYGVVTGTDPFRRYHTSHVLFNGESLVIRNGEATVASLLKQAGYRTGVIGKWHLGLGDTLPRNLNNPGRGPNDIGFDYSFLVPDGHNMHPRYYLENGKIAGDNAPVYKSGIKILKRLGYRLVRHEESGTWENRRPDEGISATLADKADAFIRQNSKEPFFLYYPTCAIHWPFKPGPKFAGKSEIGVHGDFVMEFDWMVGRIIATLDSLDLSGNTLVFVTSDNGGYHRDRFAVGGTGHDPNHPWSGWKGSALEGGHRVPMIIRWPGHIRAGTTSDETICLVDLTATACALAGIPLNPQDALDSYDISPVLLGDTGSHGIRPYTVTGSRGMEELALRRGTWKLVYTPEKDLTRLYRLDKDPGEENDLSGLRPDMTEQLLDILTGYIEAGSSRPGAQGEGKSFEILFSERDERNRFIEKHFP
jgi:arylsulfatase A-like enzyme